MSTSIGFKSFEIPTVTVPNKHFNIIINNNFNYNFPGNVDFLMRKRQAPFEGFMKNDRFDENDYIKTFNYSFRNLKEDFEEDISTSVFGEMYNEEILPTKKEEQHVQKEVDLFLEFLDC
jgi:hypothetical protein